MLELLWKQWITFFLPSDRPGAWLLVKSWNHFGLSFYYASFFNVFFLYSSQRQEINQLKRAFSVQKIYSLSKRKKTKLLCVVLVPGKNTSLYVNNEPITETFSTLNEKKSKMTLWQKNVPIFILYYVIFIKHIAKYVKLVEKCQIGQKCQNMLKNILYVIDVFLEA